MRPLLSILVAALTAVASNAPSTRSPSEAIADSLYDAGQVDSLLRFSVRTMERAAQRGDSVMVGRMMVHRGRARLALRDPHAAEDFDRALAIASAQGDSFGQMRALGFKAFVLVNQGRLGESIRLNEERIVLARELGDRGSEGWGHLLIGYAEIYRENLERAKSEYEDAWSAFDDAGRPREKLSASIGLARVLDRMGRYDDARRSYQHAWLTARELGDRNQEADVINNLGVIEQTHGDLSLAAAYYARALAVKRELRSFDIATLARNVAAVDQMLGRYAHAESTLADAATLGTNGMLDLAIAVDLGRVRLARGRLTGAAECFRDLLAQDDRLPRKTHVEVVTYLAETLAKEDSVPAAVALVEPEVGLLRADAPSIWRADAYLESSRCFRAGGDPARARATALNAWEDARSRGDSTQATLAATEVSMSEHALGNDAQAMAWFERARETGGRAPLADDFQWREARRATLARSLIASGEILRVHPPEAAPEIRERAWFDFLQHMRARTLLERVTDPRRFDDIDPALARPVTSKALQSEVLRPGECFVSVSVANAGLHVFMITPDQFHEHSIDDPDGALVRRFHNLARLSAAKPDPQAAGAPAAAARELGRLAFAGGDSLIHAARRIYLAPDGVLAGVPFETMQCPGENAPLLDAHEVVRVPCATFLQYLRGRNPPPASPVSLLAVAGDTPVLAGARDEVNHLHTRYHATRALNPDQSELLEDLSRYDVVHIASHVRLDSERPWNAGIMVGRPRTPARSRDRTASGPLALSAADSSQVAAGLPDDPFVRASEIANRRLSARLVVLSACESALGRATFAEGVLGVASSFLGAGSRAVVASLWEVEDRTTADLMERFYHELSDGRPVGAALRAAQLALRREHPEPFYWAGFVVIGDGDVTADLARRRGYAGAWWMAIVGVFCVTAASWAIWRRRARRARIAA